MFGKPPHLKRTTCQLPSCNSIVPYCHQPSRILCSYTDNRKASIWSKRLSSWLLLINVHVQPVDGRVFRISLRWSRQACDGCSPILVSHGTAPGNCSASSLALSGGGASCAAVLNSKPAGADCRCRPSSSLEAVSVLPNSRDKVGTATSERPASSGKLKGTPDEVYYNIVLGMTFAAEVLTAVSSYGRLR